MNSRLSLYSLIAAQLLWISGSVFTPAFAQDDQSAPGDKSVDKLMDELQAEGKRLTDQEKKLADQEKELAKERMEFEKLQTRVIAATGKSLPVPASNSSVAATSQRKKSPQQVAAASAPAPAPAAATVSTGGTPQEVGTDRKEEKEKPPEIAAVLDEGGVLTQKGKLVFTPSIEYDRSTATAVSIAGFSIIPSVNIGLFEIAKVDRDIVNPAVDFRYGVTNRFEIETKIPYVYRMDATDTRPIGVANAPETLTTSTGHDIGDVEFAAHYQVNNGHEGWPFLIANMRFKTDTGTSPFEVPVVNGVQTKLPTGSGFYGFQPSLTAIFPSDPVVYYGNIGYLHSLSQSFPLYGRITPGDSYSASFGMSLSLNDKASMSLGYSHTAVLKTLENGSSIPDSPVLEVGTVDIGYSYNLTDKTNLNFTVSAGVTRDAPDVRLVFRVPMTFDLF